MSTIIQIILESAWFLLPGSLANMAPILVKSIPLLDAPIDHKKTFRGKRIFGDNKTYRGFVFGIAVAILATGLQAYFVEQHEYLQKLSLVYFKETSWIILGFLFGFGALFGDAVKSFFKRQRGIDSGKSWYVFDQTDYIIGILSFVIVFMGVRLSTAHVITMIALGGGASLLSSYIGYKLKLKNEPV